MDAVDKVIFNTLARRGRLNLPGIGSLRVEQTPAMRPSRREVVPPASRIVFAPRELPGSPTLAELIGQEAGVGQDRAEAIYAAWRSRAEQEGKIVIEGTGTIGNGQFLAERELDALLNPVAAAPVRLKPRRRRGATVDVIVAAAILAISAAGYYYYDYLAGKPGEVIGELGGLEQAEAPTPRMPAAGKLPVSDSGQVGTSRDRNGVAGDSTCLDSATAATHTLSGTETTGTATTDGNTETRVAETSRRGSYHIVAGVFSTEENADKFIRESRTKADTLPYAKVFMTNGKVVVSIYQTDSEQRASHRLKQLLKADKSLWIYRQKTEAGMPQEN